MVTFTSKAARHRLAALVKLKQKAVLLAISAGAMAVQLVSSSYFRTPRNTLRLTGQAWVEELLHSHPVRFYDNMTMNRHVFCQLLQALIVKVGLGDTKHVTLEEQLTIFLYFCATGCSVRKLEEWFQRSPDTISQ
jgi:hypothetical protein